MGYQISMIFFSTCLLVAMRGVNAHTLARHAICVIKSDNGVEGEIKFEQKSPWEARISGNIKGLAEGKHGFHVHQFGDLSNGCASTGGHFNPFGVDHGAPYDPVTKRHVGDLGNIDAAEDGTAKLDIRDRLVKLDGRFSVIGRAIVVHKDIDDLGRGNYSDSKTTGHAGARLGCCVIGLANVPPPATQNPLEALLL